MILEINVKTTELDRPGAMVLCQLGYYLEKGYGMGTGCQKRHEESERLV